MSGERNDRWLGLVLRTALLALFVWMVSGQLVPICLGALFALILMPVQARLTRRLGRAGRFAPLIVTASVIVLGVIPLAFVAAEAVASVNELLAHPHDGAFDSIKSFVASWLPGFAARFEIDAERLRGAIAGLIQRAGTAIAAAAGGLAGALPGQIVDVFLFVLALFYFLRDGPKVTRYLLAVSPFPEHDTDELYASIRDTVQGAIVGQLATSAVQGGLTLLALAVFRVPGAFLFAIIATILSVIPLIGTTPVTIGAVIYLLASGRFGAAIGMAVAAVVIGLSDNVVRPLVQSSRAGMHPLLTLIGIFGGLEAFGPGGVFLGPVIAALAAWIVDTYAAVRARREAQKSPP